jgi:hypothetical protein
MYLFVTGEVVEAGVPSADFRTSGNSPAYVNTNRYIDPTCPKRRNIVWKMVNITKFLYDNRSYPCF